MGNDNTSVTSARVSDTEINGFVSSEEGRTKYRAGTLMIFNRTTMTVTSTPVIEIWWRAKRRYKPITFEAGYAFANTEERDAVLQRLNDAMKEGGAS